MFLKKGNASKRALDELFCEEVQANDLSNGSSAEALRREKLRREMLGDMSAGSDASVSVRPEKDASMNTPPATKPKESTGTIPRVQTGTIPRVQTETIPRVQTGSITRAQTAVMPRVQTGSFNRIKTEKFNKVDPVSAGEKTRKFNPVPVAEPAKIAKNRGTFVKIGAVVCSVVLICGAVIAAVLLFLKPKEEEPVIIPTDVVAGAAETDEILNTASISSAEVASYHTVRIVRYNEPEIICSTPNTTASALMDRLGIDYKNDKIVSLDVGSEITDDTAIEIKNVEYKTNYATEAVPNETVYVDDDSIYQGSEEVAVEGYDGVKTYTYKCRFVNGVEESRELVSEEITTEPVNRVINRGTKQIPVTQHTNGSVPGTVYTGAPENYLYYVDVRATWYCIEGTTATGLPTGYNVMAVDPSVIPLGSECVVIGDLGDYGHRIAADVGGGIMGNVIDIWLPVGDGFTQGWQNARVYVLREGF